MFCYLGRRCIAHNAHLIGAYPDRTLPVVEQLPGSKRSFSYRLYRIVHCFNGSTSALLFVETDKSILIIAQPQMGRVGRDNVNTACAELLIPDEPVIVKIILVQSILGRNPKFATLPISMERPHKIGRQTCGISRLVGRVLYLITIVTVESPLSGYPQPSIVVLRSLKGITARQALIGGYGAYIAGVMLGLAYATQKYQDEY